MIQKPIVAILGPTASGKSAVAMELAGRLGGEIISCDSMQVYRELKIGTAKPSGAELERVPHHLVNCVSFRERYDTNRFVREAREAAEAIWRRGKIPILVGGTGLYAKALLYGYSLQPASPEIFNAVRKQAATAEGIAALRGELRKSDPAGSIPPDTYANVRRLIRAIEIRRIEDRRGGELPESGQSEPDTWMDGLCHRQFILLPESNELRQRINIRTRRMLLNGWPEEARQLVEVGVLESPTAYQALGYREVAAWNPQTSTLEELSGLISTKTWQYARRQMTWFRRQHPGAFLVTLKRKRHVEQIARGIQAQVQIFLSSY